MGQVREAFWLQGSFTDTFLIGLGRIAGAQKIASSLKDDGSQIRRSAARAIGEIGDKNILGALQEALAKEQNEDVKKVMENAVAQLRKL